MTGGATRARTAATAVLTLGDINCTALCGLLQRYGIELALLAPGAAIPGSYWGDSEAGLGGNQLYARLDTPVHSVLHESSHYICMDPGRRARLDRDAGGDDTEESAVCYLQILLAGELADVGRERLMADMDRWGYSFRLGSTRAWYAGDAGEARDWLLQHAVIDSIGCLSGVLRLSR